jgi:antitoxin FitA
MAQLVVRNLPEAVKNSLKRRAQSHGRSLEAEVRALLEEAVRREPKPIQAETGKGFGDLMHERFKDIGLTKEELAQFNLGIAKISSSEMRVPDFEDDDGQTSDPKR